MKIDKTFIMAAGELESKYSCYLNVTPVFEVKMEAEFLLPENFLLWSLPLSAPEDGFKKEIEMLPCSSGSISCFHDVNPGQPQQLPKEIRKTKSINNENATRRTSNRVRNPKVPKNKQNAKKNSNLSGSTSPVKTRIDHGHQPIKASQYTPGYNRSGKQTNNQVKPTTRGKDLVCDGNLINDSLTDTILGTEGSCCAIYSVEANVSGDIVATAKCSKKKNWASDMLPKHSDCVNTVKDFMDASEAICTNAVADARPVCCGSSWPYPVVHPLGPSAGACGALSDSIPGNSGCTSQQNCRNSELINETARLSSYAFDSDRILNNVFCVDRGSSIHSGNTGIQLDPKGWETNFADSSTTKTCNVQNEQPENRSEESFESMPSYYRYVLQLIPHLVWISNQDSIGLLYEVPDIHADSKMLNSFEFQPRVKDDITESFTCNYSTLADPRGIIKLDDSVSLDFVSGMSVCSVDCSDVPLFDVAFVGPNSSQVNNDCIHTVESARMISASEDIKKDDLDKVCDFSLSPSSTDMQAFNSGLLQPTLQESLDLSANPSLSSGDSLFPAECQDVGKLLQHTGLHDVEFQNSRTGLQDVIQQGSDSVLSGEGQELKLESHLDHCGSVSGHVLLSDCYMDGELHKPAFFVHDSAVTHVISDGMDFNQNCINSFYPPLSSSCVSDTVVNEQCSDSVGMMESDNFHGLNGFMTKVDTTSEQPGVCSTSKKPCRSLSLPDLRRNECLNALSCSVCSAAECMHFGQHCCTATSVSNNNQIVQSTSTSMPGKLELLFSHLDQSSVFALSVQGKLSTLLDFLALDKFSGIRSVPDELYEVAGADLSELHRNIPLTETYSVTDKEALSITKTNESDCRDTFCVTYSSDDQQDTINWVKPFGETLNGVKPCEAGPKYPHYIVKPIEGDQQEMWAVFQGHEDPSKCYVEENRKLCEGEWSDLFQVKPLVVDCNKFVPAFHLKDCPQEDTPDRICSDEQSFVADMTWEDKPAIRVTLQHANYEVMNVDLVLQSAGNEVEKGMGLNTYKDVVDLGVSFGMTSMDGADDVYMILQVADAHENDDLSLHRVGEEDRNDIMASCNHTRKGGNVGLLGNVEGPLRVLDHNISTANTDRVWTRSDLHASNTSGHSALKINDTLVSNENVETVPTTQCKEADNHNSFSSNGNAKQAYGRLGNNFSNFSEVKASESICQNDLVYPDNLSFSLPCDENLYATESSSPASPQLKCLPLLPSPALSPGPSPSCFGLQFAAITDPVAESCNHAMSIGIDCERLNRPGSISLSEECLQQTSRQSLETGEGSLPIAKPESAVVCKISADNTVGSEWILMPDSASAGKISQGDCVSQIGAKETGTDERRNELDVYVPVQGNNPSLDLDIKNGAWLTSERDVACRLLESAKWDVVNKQNSMSSCEERPAAHGIVLDRISGGDDEACLVSGCVADVIAPETSTVDFDTRLDIDCNEAEITSQSNTGSTVRVPVNIQDKESGTGCRAARSCECNAVCTYLMEGEEELEHKLVSRLTDENDELAFTMPYSKENVFSESPELMKRLDGLKCDGKMENEVGETCHISNISILEKSESWQHSEQQRICDTENHLSTLGMCIDGENNPDDAYECLLNNFEDDDLNDLHGGNEMLESDEEVGDCLNEPAMNYVEAVAMPGSTMLDGGQMLYCAASGMDWSAVGLPGHFVARSGLPEELEIEDIAMRFTVCLENHRQYSNTDDGSDDNELIAESNEAIAIDHDCSAFDVAESCEMSEAIDSSQDSCDDDEVSSLHTGQLQQQVLYDSEEEKTSEQLFSVNVLANAAPNDSCTDNKTAGASDAFDCWSKKGLCKIPVHVESHNSIAESPKVEDNGVVTNDIITPSSKDFSIDRIHVGSQKYANSNQVKTFDKVCKNVDDSETLDTRYVLDSLKNGVKVNVFECREPFACVLSDLKPSSEALYQCDDGLTVSENYHKTLSQNADQINNLKSQAFVPQLAPFLSFSSAEKTESVSISGNCSLETSSCPSVSSNSALPSVSSGSAKSFENEVVSGDCVDQDLLAVVLAADRSLLSCFGLNSDDLGKDRKIPTSVCDFLEPALNCADSHVQDVLPRLGLSSVSYQSKHHSLSEDLLTLKCDSLGGNNHSTGGREHLGINTKYGNKSGCLGVEYCFSEDDRALLEAVLDAERGVMKMYQTIHKRAFGVSRFSVVISYYVFT